MKTPPIDENELINNLKDRGVKIKPINTYTQDKKGFDNEYLIGFAKLSFDEIDKGLDIMAEEVKKLLK